MFPVLSPRARGHGAALLVLFALLSTLAAAAFVGAQPPKLTPPRLKPPEAKPPEDEPPEGAKPDAEKQWTELVFPLRDGAYIDGEDVRAELKRKLKITYPPAPGGASRIRVGPVARAALQTLDVAGVLRARIHSDKIVIAFHDPEGQARVEKLLQVEWGLTLPERFDPALPTVVLVHGLESGPEAFARHAASFREHGAQVCLFDYPNDGPIATSGERLSAHLKRLAREHPRCRVAIVAHSMGGLVARHCLETPELNPGCVAALVTLGTPHHGSTLAAAQEWLELALLALPKERADKWTIINDGLGEASVDLTPGSDFLKTLNARAKPRGVAYHVAQGTVGFVDAAEQQRLLDRLDAFFDNRPRLAPRRDKARAFFSSPELVTGRGDGCVSLERATLASADSTRRFACNHVQFLAPAAEQPESQEVFGWIVEKLGW